jgi:hypothetical protein
MFFEAVYVRVHYIQRIYGGVKRERFRAQGNCIRLKNWTPLSEKGGSVRKKKLETLDFNLIP